MLPDGGFSPRSTRLRPPPAWLRGCRWRMRFSFLPRLVTAVAKPVEDAAALRRLAEWCGRYSPWTAPDGTDGVRVEITGSAHLWGGEKALAADLTARLRTPARHRPYRHRRYARRRLGDWPALRGGGSVIILPPGERSRRPRFRCRSKALRLDPTTAQGLRRVGLKRVGDLYRDAARCTCPPIWRNRGAAPRSGARQPARAVVAARRSAEPPGAVELRRADCRSRRSGAARPSGSPRISSFAWRGKGWGRGDSISAFTASTAGSSGSCSAPPARAASRTILPRSSGSGSTQSIPASASKT